MGFIWFTKGEKLRTLNFKFSTSNFEVFIVLRTLLNKICQISILYFQSLCSKNFLSFLQISLQIYKPVAIYLSKTKLKTLEVCETAIKINGSRPGQGADGKCGLVSTSSAQWVKIISKVCIIFLILCFWSRYFFQLKLNMHHNRYKKNREIVSVWNK